RPTTPRLEEWARRGVCFDRAVAPSSWTLPTHATFFTGHMPHEMFNDWRRMKNSPWELPMDNRFPTLAETLAGQGYRTAGFVANWCYCDRVYGLNRGFAHYEDQLVFEDHWINFQQVLKSSYLTNLAAKEIYKGSFRDFLPAHGAGANRDTVLEQHHALQLARKDAGQINQDFLKWLDRQGGSPFFGFLNYMDVHDPYVHHPDFDHKLGRLADPPGATQLSERMLPSRSDYE